VSRNAWIIFAAICVVILGSLIFLSRQNRAEVGDVNTKEIVKASAASGNIADHVYGATEGKVVLVEYGDFQCPSCQAAYPILKELKEEFKDELTFIFRNNPITQIHPNAKVAAAAAEAAGLQGKFWEMHDKLFEQQNTWGNASIDERVSHMLAIAEEVGIKDMDKFKSDMESKAVSDKINFDLSLGRKDNVTGTPTILLNGEKVEDWADKDVFKQKIEDAIKRAK
jgi:protein-disulfide isomerase